MAEQDRYEELLAAINKHREDFLDHKAEVKIISNEVRGVKTEMIQTNEALGKIAILVEHMNDSKKDFNEIFQRLRKVETQSAINENNTGINWDILQKIIIWIVIAALVSLEIYRKAS